MISIYIAGMCDTTIAYHCQKYHGMIWYSIAIFRNNNSNAYQMLINVLFGCICQEMVKDQSSAHYLVIAFRYKIMHNVSRYWMKYQVEGTWKEYPNKTLTIPVQDFMLGVLALLGFH